MNPFSAENISFLKPYNRQKQAHFAVANCFLNPNTKDSRWQFAVAISI